MGRESVAAVSSPPSATAPGTAVAATALAPGFRFHPTDEELVSYYLKRKVLSKPVRFDAIGEVDIYKHEPWDLAVFSRLKTRDQEWYFYSALDKKYGNGARMNRATNKGYWKATGKDREIRRDIQLLGMKKTLVFHSGRAPDGLRTNWVMHEYRLVDYETERNGNLVQDAYVLCRVFHKNNIGPPSGNRYAPFMEEEWADDDGGALIPGVDVRVRVEQPPLANGNNLMDQEIQSASKDLININEPPRETTPMDTELNHQNHQENALKLQVNNNNNHGDEVEETLKREQADEEDERPPPVCVLNKEAPLPLLQYKRRRQNESNNHSSRTSQDHCSSTITTVDNTTTLISSSAAATNTAISALLEFSLMGISDKKENPRPLRKEASPPALSTEEMINDLQKKVHQMSIEGETFKLEMMSAEAMISILQSRIDALQTSLAPGFRFHPTEEELVRYYLKRKICNKPFKFDAISVTDVYKSEPWDLPDKSKLKSRDLEWYFFSVLDKKYANGSKTNRATEKGYWKTTGKDREIRNGPRVVGMKKTLVYHKGRAPRGERTNWVMHEYRLVDEELEKAGVQQDAYVLCRIFYKSGTGPKNGEQYGAPFVEEEWEEEDDMTFVPPGSEDHVYVDMDEADQRPDNLVVYDAVPIPLHFEPGESSNNVETNYSDSRNCIQPGNYVHSDGYFEFSEEDKPIIRDGTLRNDALSTDEENGCGVDGESTGNFQSSGNIFLSDGFPVEGNYFAGEAFLDPNGNLVQSDGLYLETNDLSSGQQDGFNIEDYLTFFDENDEDAQNLTFDPCQLMGNEDGVADQQELFPKAETEELEKGEGSGGKQMDKSEASCSKQVDADATEFEPADGSIPDNADYKYPLLKKASHMLGAIPSPPAFTSELPAKDAAIRLHAAQSSGSVHVTAGMITISGSNMGWSYGGKNGNVDLLLSFRLAQENASEKSGNSLTRGMLVFMCFWVLVLSVSFKVSTLVSSR
ncbi:unnamed protein product [Thlaspi arvense]|uniref:NAC domain-containing protein n=1 Tax=Thlaspi arvense TaxID=13288 RepID=A0AAU9S040_THLAR|nr:unnamed protein product [Thlaspi arvense]